MQATNPHVPKYRFGEVSSIGLSQIIGMQNSSSGVKGCVDDSLAGQPPTVFFFRSSMWYILAMTLNKEPML